MMTRLFLLIVLLAFYFQSTAQQKKIELFDDDEPIICKLILDMRKLAREKTEELPQDAELIIYEGDSIVLDREIKLTARGIWRKNNCHIPPIKLDLRDSLENRGGFKGHKSIKLVTHCEHAKTYQKWVLREYLVYKLYNLLTEESFRVRLLDINYIDIGRKEPKLFAGYGFLIEDIDRVARRNNCYEMNIISLKQEYLNPVAMRRLALFYFMIGNTDWSIPGLHNVKVMNSNDFTQVSPVPVPYDFDMSGFVNASYAAIDPQFPISDVRTRYFRGLCGSLEEFKEALQEFQDIKETIYETILQFEYLDQKSRDNLVRYIDDFYDIIENDNAIKIRILSSCKEIY